MNKRILSPEILEVIEAIHYRPAISVILPFEPKMNAKAELSRQLKFATDQVEKEIKQNYSDDLSELVIQKLKTIIKNLNFNTYKKSIAIFVSPVFEKVLYLDIPVEERIIVDESFEIRDLVYAKKEIHKYLVLVLSGKSCKVYIGNTNTFIKVKSNVRDHIAAFISDAPERVANFSDPTGHKETILRKFFRETDAGLSFLLKTYQLPVFIMGTKKVTGYFKDLTKNDKSIIGYIHGNYEGATETELKNILKPYVNDWKKIKMRDLLNQIEVASDAGKLTTGIKEVWKQASRKKGRLLIVEKNYMYAAQRGGDYDQIDEAIEPASKFSYIKDAVDDVIEKVLEHGGDVEFVDEGMLNGYLHIALIQYY
jgi:Bacterial archaeo-eukaryotic release factor family 3